MFRNSVPSAPGKLLRVTPVVLVMLGVFAAKPASADTQVQICWIQCTQQGPTTVAFTSTGVDIPEFTMPETMEGPPLPYDDFFGATINLYANGTASGQSLIWFGNPDAYGGSMSFTNWSLSGSPGNMTLTLFGLGWFCGMECEFLGAGLDAVYATGALTITEAYIPTPTTPTPEPSSLLLVGTGLMGLFPAIRRLKT